jgi:hypothetical protein
LPLPETEILKLTQEEIALLIEKASRTINADLLSVVGFIGQRAVSKALDLLTRDRTRSWPYAFSENPGAYLLAKKWSLKKIDSSVITMTNKAITDALEKGRYARIVRVLYRGQKSLLDHLKNLDKDFGKRIFVYFTDWRDQNLQTFSFTEAMYVERSPAILNNIEIEKRRYVKHGESYYLNQLFDLTCSLIYFKQNFNNIHPFAMPEHPVMRGTYFTEKPSSVLKDCLFVINEMYHPGVSGRIFSSFPEHHKKWFNRIINAISRDEIMKLTEQEFNLRIVKGRMVLDVGQELDDLRDHGLKVVKDYEKIGKLDNLKQFFERASALSADEAFSEPLSRAINDEVRELTDKL